jgi:serine O-acetyltransferase
MEIRLLINQLPLNPCVPRQDRLNDANHILCRGCSQALSQLHKCYRYGTPILKGSNGRYMGYPKNRLVYCNALTKNTHMNTDNEKLILRVWQSITEEATVSTKAERVLAEYLRVTILDHPNLASALSFQLANKLASTTAPMAMLREIMHNIFADPDIIGYAAKDIQATVDRDSACELYSSPFLYFKGFLALQAYRVAHQLWLQGSHSLALLIQYRVSVKFAVDIHPAAKIGCGVMIDHATGLVIGETAVVEDCVSIMQSVTLGGTGKVSGDRHPKIRKGVLLGPGAKILGNIEIGEGAMVAASSVVLKSVAAHTVVAGVPSKVVGKVDIDEPSKAMNHYFRCS